MNLDPAVLGYLMVICFALIVVSADHLIDVYDEWRARGSELEAVEPAAPALPYRMRRQVRDFIASSVFVTRYGDRRRRTPALPVPDSAEDLTYERAVSW